MIILFVALIINDFVYNYNNKCSTPAVLLSSLVIGGGVGVLWSYIVNIIGNPNLQIITGTNPNITCNRPSSVSYLVKKDQIQITQ